LATTNSAVGSYAISNNVGTLSATNYAFTTVNGTLTVNAASLSITANDASKTYDGTGYTGGNGVSYVGFVNGEDATALGGSLSYGGTAQNATNAGSYSIVPSGLTSANYNITFNNGTLTVNPLAVTVTADPQTKVYGTSDPALTYSPSPALVAGDSFTGSLSRASGATVGNYAIGQGSLALSANYTLSYTGADLSITPASLTVTANSRSKTYGQTATFAGTEFTTSTLVSGDSVTGATLGSTGVGSTATIGSYPITISGATGSGLGNYNISYVSGSLTVNPLTVTVTADAQTKVYGTTDPALTYSHSPALVGSDSFTGSLSRTAGANVGNYAINQGTLALSTNYSLSYTGANLSITPASLTVTANSRSKYYGQTVTFAGTEFTTSTLVSGDSVTGASLSSTGAGSTAAVGSYPITISGATGSGLGNYNISYVSGSLTVNAATPVTMNAPVLLGDGTMQLTFTGGDNGVSYRILGSLDLSTTNWTTLTTVVAGPGGLPAYIDTDATNHTVRFYQTVTP